jgi:IS5 family transposase
MSRIPEPQLSFADLALRQQGVHLDPLLQGILTFLDEHAALVEQVRQDLVRGLKNPNTGRGGITPSQTLRSLILMRVKNWDYRELRERINDGYTLRGFTDFDSHAVPKHDAFNRAFNRITPATLQAINQAERHCGRPGLPARTRRYRFRRGSASRHRSRDRPGTGGL